MVLQFADCCDRIVKENAIVGAGAPFWGFGASILGGLILLWQFNLLFYLLFLFENCGCIFKESVINLSFVISLATFAKKHNKGVLVCLDAAAVLVAGAVSLLLKFDGSSPTPEWCRKWVFAVFAIDFLLTVMSFFLSKSYRTMWQYFSMRDYCVLAASFVVGKAASFVACCFIWLGNARTFITWFVLYSAIEFLLILFVRACELVFYRVWRKGVIEKKRAEFGGKKSKVMIIGAGNAADSLIKEFRTSVEYYSRYDVVALIDDNIHKKGEYLNGIKVYGGRDAIIDTVNRLGVDEIYLAIPSASEKHKKEILDICTKTDCKLKTLPSDAKYISTGKLGEKLRKVDYTDLLGRPQIKPDLSEAFALLKGKTVLVTGGGGSIGSELVRQIAKSGTPKTIIIFDIAENGAYEIQQEVRRKYKDVDLKVLIGSVRDEKRLCEIFEEYHPNIIYHAAAHKHVPLMEDSPKEAVKNNIFGTFNLARTADRYGVERFVMISTDKAVNPTNVMGATKRTCEMIVQSFNKISKTEFVAVRFGNVLGSNGSVIPLFKEQIEAGGPVTVTHPDIIRYFMLIPEAVSLVLQAGAGAKGGEIFILDMGTPVKISELAENLIRLSGYRVGEDIEIKYTGLREGEKLYEELLIAEEGIQKTENDLIYIAKPIEIDSDKLFSQLDALKESIETCSRTDIIRELSEIVPTYTPKNSEYEAAAAAAK